MSNHKSFLAPSLLGAALLACLGLIGFLGAGAGARRSTAKNLPAPASSTWTHVSVDPLIRAQVPALPSNDGAPAHDSCPAHSPSEAAPRAAATSETSSLRLTGQVFHADGRAAENARIVVDRHHERCDGQGQFDFTLPTLRPDADLLALVSGFEPARITGYGARFANGVREDHVRLVLGEPSLSITGQVVDREGRPRKHWLVELGAEDPLGVALPREPVRTDEEGRFRIPDVPPGWFPLRIRRAPHDDGFLSEAFEAGTETARVTTGG